ncbi:hypothetical protein C8A05DRAFT_43243 [Staphylotrichum tortipilum]|uniref:Uncharacterized protein n=1 Tax=Staphylotrichum tortipilum TaxID=2831512 RepID=A0AAN6MPD2_9PEZI|nr:hypothetical protein C8A05DRAFT_43243 [Staphylotrichum longicolle]
MGPKKTYFLAPTRDFSPTTGAIRLGNLIQSPRTPDFPLNSPTSPTLTQLLTTATTTPESNALRTLTTYSTLHPSLFTSLLSSLGIPSPLSLTLFLSKSSHSTQSYKIPLLETRTIYPTIADLTALFTEPAVQSALRDSRFEANLYIITGVQVASKGTEYTITSKKDKGGGVEVGVDVGLLAGTPRSEVAETGSACGRGGGTVEGGFVLAYSLREVVYKRKRVTGQRRGRKEGDLFGVGGGRRQEKEEVGEEEFEAELAGLKEEDGELAEQWSLEAEVGVDLEGEECLIVRVDGEEKGVEDDESEED